MPAAPDKDQVIATIRHLEPALRELGVLSASLFGSVARGEATPESDIDIAVEMADDSHWYSRFQAAELATAELGFPVDMARLPFKGRLLERAGEDFVLVFR